MEVDQLQEAGRLEEAQERLNTLAKDHPGQQAVLEMLVNVSYDLGDTLGYEYACRGLVELEPDPDLTLA